MATPDARAKDRADAREVASTVTIRDKDGNIISSNGTVQDIATGEKYQQTLKKKPVEEE